MAHKFIAILRAARGCKLSDGSDSVCSKLFDTREQATDWTFDEITRQLDSEMGIPGRPHIIQFEIPA